MSIASAQRKMRVVVLALAGIETAFWLYLAVGGLADALPFAKGYGSEAAFLGTLVFVPFVLPALVLVAMDRALPIAAVLTAGAGLLYLFDPLLRLASMLAG
jgi:hypothetical protein